MNQVSFERVNNDILLIRFAGRWQLSGGRAPSGAVERELQAFPSLARVAFDARDLGDWDSSILTVLARAVEEHVTAENHSMAQKADAAGRVTGSESDLEPVRSNLQH